MNTNRRAFLKTAAFSVGAANLVTGLAAETKREPSFITSKAKMKLGIVTYNIAKDWDVPTIIRNCAETKFQGVELRTTHKHGVEVNLSKEQRAEIRNQFADSPV